MKDKLKKLFKTGFFHIFGSSVINKVLAFLSSVVLMRILTKAEYGVFTYAWNIYSIILIFNGMGVESGVLQISSEHGGDLEYGKKVSSYGTKFGVRFNLILCSAIILIGLFIPLKIESSRVLLCSLCLLPMAQLLFGLISANLRAQKRNQEYSRLMVLNTSLVFVVSAGCAFLMREIGMVIGYYAAFIVSIAVGLGIFKVTLISDRSADIGKDKSALLKISFISMLNNGLSQLMYLLDIFVLGIVDPQETVLASYKAATTIPTALTFIPLALITYLYPYFAQHMHDRDWCLKRYKQIVLGLGALNLFISLVLFIFAPFIVKLMFGSKYLDCVLIFRMLSINYFISGTFRILSGNLLVTQRKLKFNLVVAIVSSSVNVVADYFFIKWWGSVGAAIATMVVVAVSSVMSTGYLIHTFRNIKAQPEEALPQQNE